ncbi:MAG: hypothetical protein ACN6PN_02895 [Sphingobacterium sp.]
MEKFFSDVVDFDLTLHEVYEKVYDPVRQIVDFWNVYDINVCREYLFELLIMYWGNPQNKKRRFTTDQMTAFIIALMRMQMSYYMASSKNIDLSKIDWSLLTNNKIAAEELEMSKKIHEFFHRSSH